MYKSYKFFFGKKKKKLTHKMYKPLYILPWMYLQYAWYPLAFRNSLRWIHEDGLHFLVKCGDKNLKFYSFIKLNPSN